MTTNLDQASRQWASRPDDERYVSLEELGAAVRNRRQESYTMVANAKDLSSL